MAEAPFLGFVLLLSFFFAPWRDAPLFPPGKEVCNSVLKADCFD